MLIIHRPIDHRSARTRHPHAVTLYPGLDLATVTMLLEEGVWVSEDGHGVIGTSRRVALEQRQCLDRDAPRAEHAGGIADLI